jgi:hypothetical protein
MALADEWDKLTKVTFSEPVEVPGMVLPAGTYEFKMLDSPGDRDIVQIYNADQTILEETVLAVPDERIHATGKTVIRFSERPSGSPQAVKAWFYPGSHTGIEFVYPTGQPNWRRPTRKRSIRPAPICLPTGRNT